MYFIVLSEVGVDTILRKENVSSIFIFIGEQWIFNPINRYVYALAW